MARKKKSCLQLSKYFELFYENPKDSKTMKTSLHNEKLKIVNKIEQNITESRLEACSIAWQS